MSSQNPLAYLGEGEATHFIEGIVELATTAECQAGTRDDVAVTPLGLAAVAIAGAPDATTATKGIIQIATNLDATAGASGILALVPSNLSSVFASPPPIGGTAPNSGAFTTLSATGGITFTGGLTLDSLVIDDVTYNADAITSTSTLDLDSSGALSINSSAGAINVGDDVIAQAVNIGTGGVRTITIGNATGATALVLTSGTGSIGLTSTGSGDITLASADTALIDCAGVLELNSSGGVISIGNDAVNQNMNFGTAGARTITIGNITGATAVDINSGTGGAHIVSTGAGTITAASGSTILLDSVGVLELNSSAGVISVGNDAVNQNINLGTAGARTIAIGNATGATAVNITSGTGNVALASTGAGDITLNSSDTLLLDSAGVLELNSSAGVISIGNDAVSQAINIGTAGVRTVTVGSVTGASSTLIKSGTGNAEFGANATDHTTKLGSTTGVSATTVQSGTGTLNVTGGGAVTIGAATAVSIDGTTASHLTVTGAGQDLTLSSVGGSVVISATENAADSVQITSTVGGIVISAAAASAGEDIALTATGSSVHVTSTEAAADAILLSASDAAGGIQLTTGGGAIALSSSGFVTVAPAVDTQASPTAASTLNVNVGAATFTGFTTASGSAQVFTITNSLVSATSKIFVSASNEGANDAQMTVMRVKRLAGSFEVTLKNNGAATLNGNVTVNFWVIA